MLELEGDHEDGVEEALVDELIDHP